MLGVGTLWLTYVIGYRCLRWRGPDISAELPITRAKVEIEPQRESLFQPPFFILAIALVCLVAALIPGVGVERHGSRRWLQFGPQEFGIGFQPSEFAKPAALIFLAAWLAHRQAIMRQFKRGLLPVVFVLGSLCGLIVIEDLGTAALIALVGTIMILAAGARWWHVLLLSVPGLLGFAGMIWTKPYRVERLVSHMDIWSDPLGSGYHAIQSLITIASGGIMGRGIGAGTQKYGYLPEAQNDFVFAVLCEEMGLIGGLAVVGMFLCITLLGWRIMTSTDDRFGKLLALGVTTMIGFQAAMNIAVVTVSVPTKGISLPFVSAGGSGVIFYSIAVGLLASVSRFTTRPNAAVLR